MAESSRTQQQSNDQSVLLNQYRKEQEALTQGSHEWVVYQSKINSIIADRYLQYLNR